MKRYKFGVLLGLLLALNGAARAQGTNRPDLRPELLNINTTLWKQVAPGLEHLQYAKGQKTDKIETGPWFVNILRIDPTRITPKVVHAMDEGIGVETVSDMARRYGALAAINGGFFAMSGSYRGDSVGALLMNGALLSEPYGNRAAVGFVPKNRATELVFGPLNWNNLLTVNAPGPQTPRPFKPQDLRFPLGGINRPLGPNELVMYTPEFHRTTLTTWDATACEVAVRVSRGVGVVVRVRRNGDAWRIPSDGYVLAASGAAAEWARRMLSLETQLSASPRLGPLYGDNRELWQEATDVISGGPHLVRDGATDLQPTREGFSWEFAETWHPRTAIGRAGDGKILLVTVDGRQPDLSVGMSLEMLAHLMRDYDAAEAINLDGGGSTTMYLLGRVVNSPSDKAGERPVSDAILLFPRGQQ
jgi:exopolysaccharide biosynthesis protein